MGGMKRTHSMQMLLRWPLFAFTGFYGGEGLAFILACVLRANALGV